MSERSNEKRTTVEKATDEFLRVLRERNASAHTIKAYAGDLGELCQLRGGAGMEEASTTSRFADSCRISTKKD